MNNPLVSIVIPVYNGSDFLKESIDSALSQTYTNTEIIVVNDGSTDCGKTEGIAKSYGDSIRYYEKENGGVSSALNFGIKQMKGEWFSWLSHDDLYHKDKIKLQVDKILKSSHGQIVCICGSSIINSKGHKIGMYSKQTKSYLNSNALFSKLFNGTSLNGCSLLIPKDAFLKVGLFDENLKYIQDWKMWVFIALGGYSFVSVDSNLVYMRVHANQQTLKISNQLPIESELLAREVCTYLFVNPSLNKSKIIDMINFCSRTSKWSLKKECENILISANCYTILNFLEITIKMPLYAIYNIALILFRKVKKILFLS